MKIFNYYLTGEDLNLLHTSHLNPDCQIDTIRNLFADKQVNIEEFMDRLLVSDDELDLNPSHDGFASKITIKGSMKNRVLDGNRIKYVEYLFKIPHYANFIRTAPKNYCRLESTNAFIGFSPTVDIVFVNFHKEIEIFLELFYPKK